MTTKRPPRPFPAAGRFLAALAAGACGVLALLSCHGGTPAAPEGTTIFIDDLRFVDGTRNPATGDFQALIRVRLLDAVSNVPQTGVGVFFFVDSGPGRFANASPIVTTNAGRAENVLLATGATPTNAVAVRIISGAATPLEIDVQVNGFASEENIPPVASFTATPSSPRVNDVVTVDVTASTDADCPSMRPTTWSVSWGDATPTESSPYSAPTLTHRYTTANVTRTISVTVTDCDNLTNTATRAITIAP